MKTFFSTLMLLFLVTLATGCNKLTQYTISEQDINHALQKNVQYQKELGVSGLVNAQVTLKELNSQIGREEPGKVTLTGKAHINITSLFGPQQAELNLKMKAQPVFNQQENAIYLQDIEITGSNIEPKKMQSIIDTLIPYLNQSLKQYFDQQPAYVLNEERSKSEWLAKKLAKGLEVKPGELIIPLTE